MSRTKQTPSKGLTLPELLILLVIAAALIAISIPVFTIQMEKKRESEDLSSLRSAYLDVMAAAIKGSKDSELWQETEGVYRMSVPLQQKKDGWTTNVEGMTLGGLSSEEWQGSPLAGGTATVSYVPETDRVIIDWGG